MLAVPMLPSCAPIRFVTWYWLPTFLTDFHNFHFKSTLPLISAMRTCTIFAFFCLAAGIVPSFAVPLMSPRSGDKPTHQLSDDNQPGQPSGSNTRANRNPMDVLRRFPNNRRARIPRPLPEGFRFARTILPNVKCRADKARGDNARAVKCGADKARANIPVTPQRTDADAQTERRESTH
ncbi:hypothetical protein F5148DRAFT_611985 [Russula earlei]|uniref:Uncharacterized protein n=1 Tax=Russula earlei TaxID=71964 RepID=A0ACC0TWA4_9AGAM|nr:hypothetical protein F5148DRAFT_611985 [Russula earlei]